MLSNALSVCKQSELKTHLKIKCKRFPVKVTDDASDEDEEFTKYMDSLRKKGQLDLYEADLYELDQEEDNDCLSNNSMSDLSDQEEVDGAAASSPPPSQKGTIQKPSVPEHEMAAKSDLSQAKSICWTLDVSNLTPSHFVKTSRGNQPSTATKQLTLDEMDIRQSRTLERTPRSSRKDRSGSESDSKKRKRSSSPNNTGAKSAARSISKKPSKSKKDKLSANDKSESCPLTPTCMDGDPPCTPSQAGGPS